jgi:BMFP domain-containing protein YqiC
MTDTDMLYVASLQKRNEELEARVAELEEKHFSECAQIAHYSDELRKAVGGGEQ